MCREPTRSESPARAGQRRGPSVRVALVARSVQEDANEKRAGAEAAGTGLSFLPLPARARVVAAWRRTRGCGARASVSAAGRASGAGRGAEGSRGGGSGGDCRACAPGSSRGGRGRLLPLARPLALRERPRRRLPRRAASSRPRRG